MLLAGPNRDRTRRAFSLLASALIHLTIGLLIVWAGWLIDHRRPRQHMGSNELDVDLVAPRLAPPVEHWGRSRDRPGQARAQAEATRGRQQGTLSEQVRIHPHPSVTPSQPATRARPAVDRRASVVPVVDDRRHRTKALSGQRRAREDDGVQADTSLTGDVGQEPLPEGPSPTAMLQAIQQDVRRRMLHHQQVVDQSRRRFVVAEQRLTALAAQTGRTVRSAAGTFQASVGAGGRDAQGREAQHGGRTPLYGLKFYLSGRRVQNSHVVRPPELIDTPRVRCKITSLSITPATVRMLIETNGKVGHLYLKHSSGSTVFDGCALRHAQQMRFHPGTDDVGTPLNVWINLRVEPGLLTTAGLGL